MGGLRIAISVVLVIASVACGANEVVAIWRDARVPGSPGACDTTKLESLLREQGYDVRTPATADLLDAATVDAESLDLLVLPYGGAYPAAGREVFLKYVNAGGDLLTLGGKPFSDLLVRDGEGWVSAAGLLRTGARKGTPVEDFEGAEHKVKGAGHSGDEGWPRVQITRPGAAGTRSCLKVYSEDLKTWQYVGLSLEGTGGAEDGLLVFWAKGDAHTSQLCLEIKERDNSRWKQFVDLTPEWKQYAVPISSFYSYATENRGGPGDYCHAENAATLWFGYPKGMVGGGPHAFWLDEIERRRFPADGRDVSGGFLAMPLKVSAFGKDLKLPEEPAGLKPGMFFGARKLRRVAQVRPGEGGALWGSWRSRLKGASAWTTPTLTASWDHKRGRVTLQRTRYARFISLLEASDTVESWEPIVSLTINFAGPLRGGCWACCGIADRDVLKLRGAPEAFARLIDFMLRGAQITKLEPSFGVEDDAALMRARLHVRNPQQLAQKALAGVRVEPIAGDERQPAVRAETIGLPAQGEGRLEVSIPADAFDWMKYALVGTAEGATNQMDRVSSVTDLRATAIRLGNFFLETQKRRGDGKFSGTSFVDNRGARGLLGLYEITGEERYRRGAIEWGEAMLREQREDGGSRMGYGITDRGEACYVADGGEVAVGIARLVSYVPEADKGRFKQSLDKYMQYRESFREPEGGGIGVGWCLHDYGQRPIVPLEKPTRIFASERNIYTIGCTLGAAAAHAAITGRADRYKQAERDAHWLIEHYKSYSGGPMESVMWAREFLKHEGLKGELERELREKFIGRVVKSKGHWWTGGGGRSALDLDGLQYFYTRIEQDPAVLAAMMRAVYYLCNTDSPDSLDGIISQRQQTADEWRYMCFVSVALADMLQPMVSVKPFQ